MHTVTVTDARTGHSQPVVLFAPEDSSLCSITLEPLAVNTPMWGLDLKAGPVSAHPTLMAVRLKCGHCFNAMALLIHFAKNTMQCPLCRRGSHSSRLNLRRHFGSEPWLRAVEASIGREPPAQSLTFVDIPVHATFMLYGTGDRELHRLPTVAMRCLLELVHRRAPMQYRMPSAFARRLEQQIRDMDVAFLQIRMYHTGDEMVVDMAHMQATVYPFPLNFEPLVEPSSEHVCFENSNVKQFIYTPSEDTLDSIVALTT